MAAARAINVQHVTEKTKELAVVNKGLDARREGRGVSGRLGENG
jgi:hypothetical protein